MSRRIQRGVRKIETFKHEVSQIEVPIYLNTNNSTFEAELEQDGERFVNKDLNDLKKELKAYLDGRVDLGWRWVIELEFTSSGRYSSQTKSHVFGFRKSKYLLSSHRVNGKYLKTERRKFDKNHYDYGNEESYYLNDSKVWRWNQREDEGDVVFPCQNDGDFGGRMAWIEYSDEVWAALGQMQERISQVSEQFMELIGTEEGVDRIHQMGREILLMLPAPVEEQDDE